MPVVCPECAKELLTAFSIGEMAQALDSGASIGLYSQCHDKTWQATAAEREQLREYLEATNVSRLA
jgi:hypothetical protein